MSYRDDYREAQRHALWTAPRALLAAFLAIVAIFLLAVAVTPLTIGFGWFSGEANLRSFGHVAQTYSLAFDDARALDANARQACRFQALLKTETGAAKTQRESQLLAIESNYDRVKGEYDAYMEDHFRGGVIRPRQLPSPYPGLRARQAQVC